MERLAIILGDPDYELLSESDKADIRMRYARQLREEREKTKIQLPADRRIHG
jgi:hypothetical protein